MKEHGNGRYEEEYAKLRLRVVDEGLFHVKEDFPRITSASFASDCPAGVERVEYEISLSGYERLLAGNDERSKLRCAS